VNNKIYQLREEQFGQGGKLGLGAGKVSSCFAFNFFSGLPYDFFFSLEVFT